MNTRQVTVYSLTLSCDPAGGSRSECVDGTGVGMI